MVPVAGSFDFGGQFSESGRAVVGGVAFAGVPGWFGFVLRVQEGDSFQGAILRHEEEDEAIDDPENLSVKIRQWPRRDRGCG